MTERTEGIQVSALSRYWPVAALFIIVVVGLVFAYVRGLLPPEIVLVDLEEATEEVEPTRTPLPSPTSTKVPPTVTPTQTVEPTSTSTFTPTMTPTVTETPYPTPVMAWTDFQRGDFVSYGAGPPLLDFKFQLTYPCHIQGKGWSEDADPMAREYFTDVQACISRSSPGGGYEIVRDQETIAKIQRGEVEPVSTEDFLAGKGEYFLFPFADTPDHYQYLEYIKSLDIPEWEWARFVERNLYTYGDWPCWCIREGQSKQERAECIWDYLALNYGNPNRRPYAPNFGPPEGNPYYQWESRRLGLINIEGESEE